MRTGPGKEMLMKRIAWTLVAACALLLLQAVPAPAQDGGAEPAGENGQQAPDEKPDGEQESGGEKKPDDEKKREAENRARAASLFDKAVAWQGKPAGTGKLIDLQVDRIRFKLWAKNEVEGNFQFWYTRPDKVRFTVWTKAWWRSYWTNGEASYKKTGATKGGCEYLNPEVKEDRDAIALVDEALRIARLVILENHKGEGVAFEYFGLHEPKGKPDTPKCHLIERNREKSKDAKDVLFFYLSPEDFHPMCIGVWEFLNIQGTFFIHLSKYAPFEGVRFPTRIEIYQLTEQKEFRKFLFADVVHDPEKSLKVRINQGIDDEIYEFQKD
jgi:hypothetical protein